MRKNSVALVRLDSGTPVEVLQTFVGRPVEFTLPTEPPTIIVAATPRGISPGWQKEDYALVSVLQFIAPPQTRIIGDPTYSIQDGQVVELFEVEAI